VTDEWIAAHAADLLKTRISACHGRSQIERAAPAHPLPGLRTLSR
jgi:hypothetical protein